MRSAATILVALSIATTAQAQEPSAPDQEPAIQLPVEPTVQPPEEPARTPAARSRADMDAALKQLQTAAVDTPVSTLLQVRAALDRSDEQRAASKPNSAIRAERLAWAALHQAYQEFWLAVEEAELHRLTRRAEAAEDARAAARQARERAEAQRADQQRSTETAPAAAEPTDATPDDAE